MSNNVTVNTTAQNAYHCIIEKNSWQPFLQFCESSYSPHKIFVIIDENVNALHGADVRKMCAQYFNECHVVEIAEGEQSKSYSVWHAVVDELLENNVERSTPVLAVGGGVTGDLAGFAAATALRGVPLIHMPTSLLAMVDSSIGGKTGMNHTKGKNLIGSFYQPDMVFAYLPFLQTLPDEEWVNGMAEILKYAAISKPSLFDELEQTVGHFSPNAQWEQIIYQSVQIKGAVVEADTYEAGKRAFLNFGHTFGHALEKMADYNTISHGEAVFIGMLAATHYSAGCSGSTEMDRLLSFKSWYDIDLPDASNIDRLIDLMYSDKKVKDGIIRLILLNKWGDPYIKKTDERSLLKEAWQVALDEF